MIICRAVCSAVVSPFSLLLLLPASWRGIRSALNGSPDFRIMSTFPLKSSPACCVVSLPRRLPQQRFASRAVLALSVLGQMLIRDVEVPWNWSLGHHLFLQFCGLPRLWWDIHLHRLSVCLRIIIIIINSPRYTPTNQTQNSFIPPFFRRPSHQRYLFHSPFPSPKMYSPDEAFTRRNLPSFPETRQLAQISADWASSPQNLLTESQARELTTFGFATFIRRLPVVAYFTLLFKKDAYSTNHGQMLCAVSSFTPHFSSAALRKTRTCP